MDLREIGINASNWLIRLSIGILEGPCECGIDLSGSISHGVS
jgi:hypothetical protein